MTNDQIVTIIASGIAFIASIIATGVSIYNSRFKRYAKEQWWERQDEAYRQIINALSSLVHYYESHYDAYIDGRRIPEERHEEISLVLCPPSRSDRSCALIG